MNNNKKLIKNLLGEGNFWTLSKALVKNLGYKSSMILTHLIDISKYKNMPEEFYQQHSRIMETLFLSETDVRLGIKKLVEEELISVKKKGIPAKHYFTIHYDNVVQMISEYEEDKIQTRYQEELE